MARLKSSFLNNLFATNLAAPSQIGHLVINGTGGNDTLTGTGGSDTLFGGAGNDTLYGGNGDDTMFGGDGTDTYYGGAGIDTVSFTDSTAGVTINIGIATGTGGTAAGDFISKNVEALIGSNFADLLDGNELGNTIYGADGNDTLFSGGPEGFGDDTLYGGNGNDWLFGGGGGGGTLFGGNDMLFGGAGDDTMSAGDGSDTFFGGTGIDTVSYLGSSAGVSIIAGSGTGTGGDAQGDVIANDVEVLVGSNFTDELNGVNGIGTTIYGADGDDLIRGGGTQGIGANTVYGGNGDDMLFGGINANSGNDVLFGDAGNDLLVGGPGADHLDGGAGIDTVDYGFNGALTSGVTVDLGLGTGIGGDAQGDVLVSIEAVQGTILDDSIIGSAGSDTLYGGDGAGAGADVLSGAGGADTLYGGDGTDKLTGGAGADMLFGGAGSDVADYTSSNSAVTVSLATGTGTGGDAQGDTLVGIETLAGSSSADVLFGDAGANMLAGNGGDDTLEGGGGADILQGGAGTDFASYAGASAGVSVDLSGNPGTGDAAGDTFSSIEGLIGSAFADVLVGGGVAGLVDTIYGGGGDDAMIAGIATDNFYGGAGFDGVSYVNSAAAVTVNIGVTTGIGGSAAGDFISKNVEALTGSVFGDLLDGNEIDNTIYGGAGGDTLFSGGPEGYGNDTLYGGTSDDTLFGGNGGILGDAGANQLFGDAGNDTLYGGTGNDALFGGANDDFLKDTVGTDSIFGGTGNDIIQYSGNSYQLSGDAGTDTLLGTGGDDSIDLGMARFSAAGGGGVQTTNSIGGAFEVFDLGDGNDRLFFSAPSVNDLTATVFGGNGNDLIAMTAGGTDQGSQLTLYGGAGNDTIYAGWYGYGGNATVFGGDGNDFIYGGAGTTLAGGYTDTLSGGNGFDVYYWSPKNGGLGTDLIQDANSDGMGNGLVIFGGNTGPASGFPGANDPINGQVDLVALGGDQFRIDDKANPQRSITFSGGEISVINLQSTPAGGPAAVFVYDWDANAHTYVLG